MAPNQNEPAAMDKATLDQHSNNGIPPVQSTLTEADAVATNPLPVDDASNIKHQVSTEAALKRPHPEADDDPSSSAENVPPKRIALAPPPPPIVPAKKLFTCGNYDRYYGYRNADHPDIRLEAFAAHPRLFEGADILDIGCNRGAVSLAVAERFAVRSMLGMDVDKSLIGAARQQLAAEKRRRVASDGNEDAAARLRYPHTVFFKHGNYVLGDETLLALEQPQFDTILCLSVSKWFHLNAGDAGLKLAFRRMFRQLRPGGRLVLEAQPWKSYKRRKRLTPEIAANYAAIRMQPTAFGGYLMGEEVGFERCWRMELPESATVTGGFRRPIVVYEKGGGKE